MASKSNYYLLCLAISYWGIQLLYLFSKVLACTYVQPQQPQGTLNHVHVAYNVVNP